jgi:hypothetical protein
VAETRIRVLELSPLWGLGGTEQAIELRASCLPRAAFEVLAVGVEGGGPRLERLSERGIRTLLVHENPESLPGVVREFAPHIVHYGRSQRICPFSMRVQAACAAVGVPVLIETNVFGRPPGFDPPRSPDLVAHMSLTSMLRHGKLTRHSMQSLAAGGHAVVYNPVNTSVRAVPERAAKRRELGVADTELLACRVARADLRKWSARLEHALPRLLETIPTLRFLFMAAPPRKERELRARFGERLIFLPEEREPERVASTYAACDLMIHSSGIGESFGVSMAEGMCWRLPVVVDSTPGMDNAQLELVQQGVTGFVVGSADGLVQAAQLLAGSASLREQLGSWARQRALALFGEQSVALQWQRWYVELLDRHGLTDLADLVRQTVPGAAVPAPHEYSSYEELYQTRCRQVLWPHQSSRERAGVALRRLLDTAGYAREIGPERVLHVLRSRLRSSASLRRD